MSAHSVVELWPGNADVNFGDYAYPEYKVYVGPGTYKLQFMVWDDDHIDEWWDAAPESDDA